MQFNNTKIIQGAVFLAALLLTACGSGGGSGGGATPPPPPPLAAGTFTKSFAPAATGGAFFPFYDGDVMSQNLYLASEIQGSGNITTLRFQRNQANAAAVTCPNTTIKLGHTDLTDLTATFADNVQTGQGSLVTVLNNATLTIPAGAADAWFDIPLTTSFAYNGTDNLVVQLDHTTACSAKVEVGRIIVTPSIRRSVAFAADTTPGTADYNQTTGAAGTTQPLMQFVFAGGDNKQDYGGAFGNNYPFGNIGGYGLRTQNLYLAANINGSGPVTGIGFQMNATSVAGTYAYSLTLGHSTLAALTSNFANNYSGTPVTVANAVTFTIPAGVPAGEWIWVPIPTGVFSYNGTDNLIVDVATTAGTANNGLRYATIAGRRVLADSATATTGGVDNGEYHIALRFHGGGMSKLSANNGLNNVIFNSTFSIATLYSATDLGTVGSITSVGCRLRTPSAAASYTNYKVVMGHATAATLSGTAATDFVSQNTVFNGTVAVPAGLLAGDWIDIPLTTPFAYDGKSNLIVWLGNNGTGFGTVVVNDCMGEENVARYTGGAGMSATGVGSATYTPSNWTTDIRMAVQK